MSKPAAPAVTPQRVQRTYLMLTLFSTLAASLIWGVNTLFLLDSGLSNTEAFAANAFFTAGQVLCEVPTGVIADVWGRRTSYVLGTLVLLASTLLYWQMWSMGAPFWGWAAASALIGLGFTFFSGATEAWLVDALHFTGFQGSLDSVFARGQMVGGAAMLSGSVAGGFLAQATSLGAPYLLRCALLGVTFLLAVTMMRDLGFKPARGAHPLKTTKTVLKTSLKHGLGNRPVRWVMLAAPFASGVGIYAFYAAQPYLLELYGNTEAYGVAGLAAAIVAGSQVAGGFAVPWVRRLFKRRTSLLITTAAMGAVLLAIIGLATNFYFLIACLVVWGMIFSVTMPVRQAYLNGLIPSEQRATVLSFDSLMGSSGGVVIQPVLGRAADAWSYGQAYIASAAISALSLPFLALARGEDASSDSIDKVTVSQ